jgi:hypothetical protein
MPIPKQFHHPKCSFSSRLMALNLTSSTQPLSTEAQSQKMPSLITNFLILSTMSQLSYMVMRITGGIAHIFHITSLRLGLSTLKRSMFWDREGIIHRQKLEDQCLRMLIWTLSSLPIWIMIGLMHKWETEEKWKTVYLRIRQFTCKEKKWKISIKVNLNWRKHSPINDGLIPCWFELMHRIHN